MFPALLLLAAMAQPNSAVDAARAWHGAHQRQILDEFFELLRIPNAGPERLRDNANFIRTMLEKRGVSARLLEMDGVPPAVYGELRTPGARRTIAFYAHYDGQAVRPAEWKTPPFEPTIRDGRVWARSASDDKTPIIALVAALDAMRAANLRPAANIKFFFEGEEEGGSPHLEQVANNYKDLLAADLWLICDGPVHQTGRQQIAFGARGIQTARITVYGPNHDLHSGHYGNWAPNPAMMLAHLLASMKDDNGRVLVNGFYDGIEPLSASEKAALAGAPDTEALLKKEFALGRTEGGGRPLVELLNLPSLNVRGLASGSTGAAARTVVPSTATAEIDMRLVKGIEPDAAFARLVAHIRRQGFYVVDREPDAATLTTHPKVALVVAPEPGYRASRTSMDLEISQQVIRAVEAARGTVVKLPTMGGSAPLWIFTDLLKTPTITIPIANYDNNQHAANENLRLENLWQGIETMAALLAM
jgi:acetylornithine deacetylase/succinyl-diaminopimelate desuccinylase-like protein